MIRVPAWLVLLLSSSLLLSCTETKPSGCSSNADCVATVGHICAAGTCVACAVDADCGPGKKCAQPSTPAAACLECLVSTDCGPGKVCSAGRCAMGCEAGSTCPTGQVCDLGSRTCVACVSDKDCSGQTPKCDTAAHKCVGCVVDNDCPAGSLCTQGGCSLGCSAAKPSCPTGQVCDTAAGACVECLTDGNCKNSATPRCDAASHRCVACLPAADNCPKGKYCAGTGCVDGCKDSADCGGAMPQCDVQNHACVACLDDSACPLGKLCMNQQCVDGCNQGHGCPTGKGCCNGGCVPLDTSTDCGACGVSCGSNGQCAAGQCGCATGYADCDKNRATGCEITTDTDPVNCGACGTKCVPPTGATATCVGGKCGFSCAGGALDCDKLPANGCEIPPTDPKNCGGCGTVCKLAHATAGCAAGSCTVATCDAGWGDCDKNPANGCELDLLNDKNNCGKCGTVCTTGTCSGGYCGPFQWTTESTGVNVTTAGRSWVSPPGLPLTFTLAARATVLVRWTGTLRWAGGGNGLCHVGQRFLVDGQPTGDPSWGDAIMVLEGSQRWHELFTTEIAVKLDAGQHTITPQMINADGYGACYLDGDSGLPYDRSRLGVAAYYDAASVWYAESTGDTGNLGGNSAWTDVPGAATTISLPAQRLVQMSVQGTQYISSGTGHCAYRLVIDNVPVGHPDHGLAIAVSNNGNGWWKPVALKYGATLGAGDHPVKLQMRNSSTGGTCGAGNGNNGYARFRFFANAVPSGNPSFVLESTGPRQSWGPPTSWMQVNNLRTTFTLPADSHVQFEVAGTQNAGSPWAHCAWRLVLDNNPLGNSEHGLAIHMGSGSYTWWSSMGILTGLDLKAGQHTIAVEGRNSSGSGSSCLIEDTDYGRVRLLVRTL